jgi:hypothetical protein
MTKATGMGVDQEEQEQTIPPRTMFDDGHIETVVHGGSEQDPHATTQTEN